MSQPRQSDWRLRIYEVLPSTSDLCRELAAAGEPEGLAVIARRQTGGRGSRGRQWQSPAGNLYLSVLLRPPERARHAAQWALLSGVAVAEALAAYLPRCSNLSLKWPNDILLDGAKLAGILLDSATDDSGGIDWLVVGIGVNLAVSPEVEGRRVACVADRVTPPPPEHFGRDVLARLGHWRDVRRTAGFAPVRAAWLRRAPEIGSTVTIRQGARLLAGGFEGLGDDGSLLLADAGGVRAITTGEVLL